MAGGAFHFLGAQGLFINMWNANNHQTTWGVLRAAVTVLEDYMSKGFGTAEITIWDGVHQVSQGVLGKGR